MSYYNWKPYVPVAKRRANSANKMKQLEKKGKVIEPVTISGRKIARTFWGEAWCNHLERFSDFANRLPRGRTYARNGSICHLGISEGRVEAFVSGSSLYEIGIDIKPLSAKKWQQLRKECTGQIGSMLELLQGRFSNQVMEIVTHREQGLFPKPSEISMHCNCPDWADLCKHLAAVLYGVGARLDKQPELLFKLRGVDHQELISAELDIKSATQGSGRRRRLQSDDLGDVFGIKIENAPEAPTRRPKKQRQAQKAATPALSDAAFVPTSASVTQLRTRFGLNKRQFARLVGVSVVTISNWENAQGELRLQQKTLRALRNAAKLSLEQAQKRLNR